MIKTYLLAVLTMVMVLGAGCAHIPGAASDPYQNLSQDEYDALALREANQVRAHNPAVEAYLYDVLVKLYGEDALVEQNVRVVLIASGDPGVSTLPGGLLLWNIGTFDHLQSEDEVAAILAHEMTHLTARHHDTNASASLIDRFMAAGETAVVFSGAGSMTELWAAANSVRWASDSVLFPSFTREEETEADTEATRTLVAAGYNADAIRDMLVAFRNFYGEQAEFVGQEMFAFSAKESDDGTRLNLNIKPDAILGNLKGYAQSRWGQAYETFEERETAVRSLLMTEFSDRSRSRFRKESYTAMLESASVNDWMSDHRVGFKLMGLKVADQSGLAEFQKAVDYLRASDLVSEAFVYGSIFKAALKNEQSQAAANVAAELISSDSATLEQYLIYGTYERQQGKPENALAAFELADASFSSEQNRIIVPLILSAKDQAGMKQGTTALRCLDPSLTMACLQRQ